MIAEAQVAWLHFLGTFALAGIIGAELVLYRRAGSLKTAPRR